jgi:diadenosine tetraphosphate (Ap4A) HIT family hydrolase
MAHDHDHPAADNAPTTSCPLCLDDGGELVLRTDLLRVVLVDEPDYPGYCRVILNAHAREMTDLAPPQIARLMGVVFAVEDAQRAVLNPLKINLASFGNMTPHLHWHVIPRWADDAHFPHPVWGSRQRESDPLELTVRRALLPQLAEEIRSRVPAAPATA